MYETIKVAISPCPNDTYIFGHWINDPTGCDSPLNTEVSYQDIQVLNQLALNAEFDVIKISAAQISNVLHEYQILDVGAAMGIDCGPLLVTRQNHPHIPQPNWKIAIPGHQTTAKYLLEFAYPDLHQLEENIFHEIENAVLQGKYDAGVIIHESRFTYELKGLICISDLGKHWFRTTGLPIPLGVIAIKRNLPIEIKLAIQKSILSSLEKAKGNFDSIKEFIYSHAQEMDPKVIEQHIGLYVNRFSRSLGEEGRHSIQILLSMQKKLPVMTSELFFLSH